MQHPNRVWDKVNSRLCVPVSDLFILQCHEVQQHQPVRRVMVPRRGGYKPNTLNGLKRGGAKRCPLMFQAFPNGVSHTGRPVQCCPDMKNPPCAGTQAGSKIAAHRKPQIMSTMKRVAVQANRLPERLNIASTRRAYAEALADGVEPTQVLAGARYYAKVCAGREPRYVASPRKWLADARWQEAPQPSADKPVMRSIAPADELTRAVETAIHAENRGGWVFVREGSPAWRAWGAAFSHACRPFAAGRLKIGEGRGRSFPTEFPPIPTISSSMKGNHNEHRDLH